VQTLELFFLEAFFSVPFEIWHLLSQMIETFGPMPITMYEKYVSKLRPGEGDRYYRISLIVSTR